jgi:hypothetical protein
MKGSFRHEIGSKTQTSRAFVSEHEWDLMGDILLPASVNFSCHLLLCVAHSQPLPGYRRLARP